MTVGHNFNIPEEQQNEYISQLREKFLRDFNDDIVSGEMYDSRDITRIRTHDEYLLNFLKHVKWSVGQAATLIDKSLKWRKEINVNDLNEEYFPKEIFTSGAIYPHNCDKDNHRILLFHIGKHKKDSSKLPLLKKFIAFWLDRLFWENMSSPIVVVFDMTNAGLGNLDMDLIKYIINCFEECYPEFLAYLVNFEMPWILNAAWKIIKGWLSEDARAHVRFANKKDIVNFISVDQLLVHMGGQDSFQYDYTPGQYTEQFADADSGVENHDNSASNHDNRASNHDNNTGNHDNRASNHDNSNQNGETSTPSKQVHFNNGGVDSTGPDGPDGRGGSSDPPLTPRGDAEFRTPSSDQTRVRRRKSNSLVSNGSDSSAQQLIQIQPSLNEIDFGQVTGTEDVKTILKITNISSKIVSYKIRTTSVQGYKVHPSSGFLAPSEVAEVTIHLKGGHMPTRDRFMVLAAVVPSHLDHMDANMFWKSCSKSLQTENRLTCVVNRNDRKDVSSKIKSSSDTPQEPSAQQLTHLLNSVNTMQSQLRKLIILNFVVIFLFLAIFLFLILEGRNIPALTGSEESPTVGGQGGMTSGDDDLLGPGV